MMRKTLKERLASPDTCQGDFLDHALKDLNTDKFLTEDFILQIMFGLLFASSESTSITLTLILKFLSENPHVLEELEVSLQLYMTKSSFLFDNLYLIKLKLA